MLHESTAQAGKRYDGGIGTNQNSDAPSTPRGSGGRLLVQSNIRRHNNGISAIPGTGFNPIDGVEQGVRTTVASIHGIGSFKTVIIAEQLRQNALDRLGLVKGRLSTNFQSAYGLRIDGVLGEKRRNGRQREGAYI